MDRRSFLKAAAGAGVGAVAFNQIKGAAALVAGPPARTPVKNIVVLMMENRSVDHYLGWYGAENPAFDGIQHAAFPDLREAGAPLVDTENWGKGGRRNYHGRAYEDPSHGWDGGRVERNGGACDGWLDPATGNDEYALSYYNAADIPVWAHAARNWQTYDRWFCSLLGPTQPNRYYLHSGQSHGLKSNDLPPTLASQHPEWTLGWDWPTIWTLLDNAGVSGSYYFSNLPELLFWGTRHLDKCRPVADFYLDCALGTLPQVSFIDPWFTGPEGISNDDHPHADIRLGQQFLSDIIEAFVRSKQYRQSALVITYDEWGGFWDHVDPPRVDDDRGTPGDPGGANDFSQLGFRIPSTIISPWTRGETVDHTVYEHTSILKFVSDNWGLPYLTRRHEATNSIETAFRGFTTYNRTKTFKRYDAPLYTLWDATLDRLANGEIPTLAPLPGIPSLPLPSAQSSDLHALRDSGFMDGMGINLDQRIEDTFLRTPTALLRRVRRNAEILATLV